MENIGGGVLVSLCVSVCVQPFPIDDSYCGERDMNHPIQGSPRDPVWREAALTWVGDRVSTVAVTSTGQHTVAFLGTVQGHLNKVGCYLSYIATYTHTVFQTSCIA